MLKPGRGLRGAVKVEESFAIEYMLPFICGWLGDDGASLSASINDPHHELAHLGAVKLFEGVDADLQVTPTSLVNACLWRF